MRSVLSPAAPLWDPFDREASGEQLGASSAWQEGARFDRHQERYSEPSVPPQSTESPWGIIADGLAVLGKHRGSPSLRAGTIERVIRVTRRAIRLLVLTVLAFACVILGSEGESATEGLASLSQVFTRGQCQERGDVRFTASPANPEDLSHIFPLGLMTGAHVTPVDHQYYYWASLQVPLTEYSIHSPADGVIVQVDYMHDDYRVVIEHSCDVFTIWIHLEELAGPLAHLNGTFGSRNHCYDRLFVAAGEIIAYDGGTNGFDFSVHDDRVILPGFIDPTSYIAEPWKVHTVDPYDYFDEPVRSQLLTKNVRHVEPLGGKIDHDVPGSLMGNWFVENTNGYAGNSDVAGTVTPDQQVGYWSTHLAIAPDPIDPRAIFVSLGSVDGRTVQHAIGNLDPHPAMVTADSGLVKYELVGSQYIIESTGQPWFGITRIAVPDIVMHIYPQHIEGTVLLQLLDDHHLKAEAFLRLRQDQVHAFTDAARIYTR